MGDLENEQSHESEHALSIDTKDDDDKPICWGCGLHLLLPEYTPVFKCGWCGAITNQHAGKQESKCYKWRRLRDQCFVCFLLLFMLFIIGGGVWAVYPFVFSVSYFCGVFHLVIASFLSISTLSSFFLASFGCAGTQSTVLWGSYPLVGKGDLANYTFCHYCSKPKSPRTHHCRTCGVCVLDMDHHCPFIGNCVGAGNHRPFILFLISTVVSTIYVAIMCANAGWHTWPSLSYNKIHIDGYTSLSAMRIFKDIAIAFLNSAALMSSRGILILYLFIMSISVNLGLSALLWQQLYFIYGGKTYLSNLKSEESSGKRDCQNLIRFFGFTLPASRILPIFRQSEKKHTK